jgi:hypothetical protein
MMNERFLELAEQLPGWTSTDDGAYIGPQSSALKLYAELIVRECMKIHKDTIDTLRDDPIGNQLLGYRLILNRCLVEYRNKIDEQLGVE